MPLDQFRHCAIAQVVSKIGKRQCTKVETTSEKSQVSLVLIITYELQLVRK